MTNNLFFVFWWSGDLFLRKIAPSFFDASQDWLIDSSFEVVALGRKHFSDDEFRNYVWESLAQSSRLRASFHDEVRTNFLEKISYHAMDATLEDDYHFFQPSIDEFIKKNGKEASRIVFFLAVPPGLMEPISLLIHQSLDPSIHDCIDIMVEKPFWYDHQSAQSLNTTLVNSFSEPHIYRLDHYLAKYTIQQFIERRRSQGEELAVFWNSDYISSLHIGLLENLDIVQRWWYYDEVGALRDMIQNHALELLVFTLTPYQSFEDVWVRSSMIDSLRIDDVILGQYQDYTKATWVDPDSSTETYVYLTCSSRSQLRQGIPLVLETGKALNQKQSCITIVFHNIPETVYHFFESLDGAHCSGFSHGSFTLTIEIKDTSTSPHPYEMILHNVLANNHHLFVSGQEALSSWKLCDTILQNKKDGLYDLVLYEQWSSGPSKD